MMTIVDIMENQNGLNKVIWGILYSVIRRELFCPKKEE